MVEYNMYLPPMEVLIDEARKGGKLGANVGL
mgnify:CR=1 FL=1